MTIAETRVTKIVSIVHDLNDRKQILCHYAKLLAVFQLAQCFHAYFPKTFFMDNPNKKKADGKRISKQDHEVAYQAKKSAASNGKAGTNKATKSKKG